VAGAAAMKPAPFAYEAPASLAAALDLLGRDGAVALAGGQSLVPMLNFRLAKPALVVDLNRIAELDYLRRTGGVLRIGALTRQRALERSPEVVRGWPLLVQAVRFVGHAAIRSRGTVGGSAAHADPRAELPVALSALGARVRLRSPLGERSVPVHEFFLGPLRTGLAPGELLTELEVPPLPAGARTAFTERARTHGSFATAGAAVVVSPGEHCAIALLGAAPVPVRSGNAEAAVIAGAAPAEAAALAVQDVHDDYRRALLGELVRRALGAVMP